MKGIMNRAAVALIPPVARFIIRFLKATMRLTYVNADGFRGHIGGGGRMILAFWHGRLLMMPYSYPGDGITILVSTHRDGELIARTVKGFGIESVRGSTTRGWFKGVKGLLGAARGGRDLAITPDGPKGPREKVQMGVIQLARATGLPIIPAAFGASKKKLSQAGTAS